MKAQKRFAAYAWFVLAFAIAVVLWGAGVRATGSGAGCGDQWPLCNGGWLPRAPALHTIIEFTHRITSGPALGLLVIGLVVFAFRLFPRRHIVRRLSVMVALFTVTEALIGAALVLLGHVAANASPDRAYSLGVHLLNTMILLAAMALTAWFASASANERGTVSTEAPVSRSLLVCAPLAFLVTSIIGAIAALGDTLFPARSLAEGLKQDLSPSVHIFVRLRVWHPIVAVLLGCFLVVFAFGAGLRKQRAPLARRLALAVVLLTFLQIAAGIVNVLLLAPVWMQITHLFIADTLWIALVLLVAEVSAFGRSSVVAAPDAIRRVGLSDSSGRGPEPTLAGGHGPRGLHRNRRTASSKNS
jgi:heme A synthase